MTEEGYCNQFVSVFFCLVFLSFFLFVHLLALITQKTILSIKFKFGGQILYGVHMDSSKFAWPREEVITF